jgi:uncharacterized membrane protein
MTMTPFLLLKVVHILAAIVALGANVTYAFWLRHAGRDPERLVFTIAGIRRLDNFIATPAYAVVLATGIGMVLTGAYSFGTGWVVASIALYVVGVAIGIAFFAPALRRQLAEAERDPSSPAYAAAALRSNLLGVVTIAIFSLIVVLMVTKPF